MSDFSTPLCLSLLLAHIHYSEFLLLLLLPLLHYHHHHHSLLQLSQRVEAERWEEKKLREGGCIGHGLLSKPENQEAAATSKRCPH